MTEVFNPLFNIRLFFIKHLRGEDAYHDAILTHACKRAARQVESKSYRGFVSKRAIARYCDVPMSYLTEIAAGIGVEAVSKYRMQYYRMRDAVAVL